MSINYSDPDSIVSALNKMQEAKRTEAQRLAQKRAEEEAARKAKLNLDQHAITLALKEKVHPYLMMFSAKLPHNFRVFTQPDGSGAFIEVGFAYRDRPPVYLSGIEGKLAIERRFPSHQGGACITIRPDEEPFIASVEDLTAERLGKLVAIELGLSDGMKIEGWKE
jgi:hypothetical protein